MSSIWSSLSGIRAHQFMLDVIGNNLANADTTGFKASRVTFSEMMNQTLRPAASGTDTLGGTNPVQVGLGVEVGQITRDFTQGRLQDTGNPLDLSIDGNGFMVLNDGTRNVFSRSTTYSLDAGSYLVDSVTGYRVMATTNQSIQIPYNEQIPAQKTTTVDLAGNLSTSLSVPTTEEMGTIAALRTTSGAAVGTTDLNDLTTNGANYVAGDTIVITGTKADGTALTPVTFTYGATNDGTTVADLIDAMNSAYGASATASLDASGNILLTAAHSGPASLSVNLADGAGNTGGTDWVQHAFYVQTEGADGGSHNISSTVYDSRGDAHILTFTFTRVDEREWTMNTVMSDTTGTLTKSNITNIRFNKDGSYNSIGATGLDAQKVIIDYGSAAESQSITINLGSSGKFNGLTLFGGTSTAASMSQDGFAPGTLKSFSIGRDGMIQGMYTNGQRRDLSQIKVATFDNPEGLETLGHGMWVNSVNSGDPIYGTAMAGRAGAIVAATLEGSNVESASELTKLIVAQHGFQMSTRAMSVSSRTLQELAQVI